MLENEGIEAEIHEVDGVYNLTAETGTNGKHICLNGHLDVVEPEGKWHKTKPFDPRIEDGTLYGRGASDMKGAFASQIKAFIDLHKDDDFNGKATLMAAGDEEIGGSRGSKHFVEDVYQDEEFDYALVGEATDLDVQVGTRGVLWINVNLHGEGVHASRAHQAQVNIIKHLPDVLDRLNDLQLDYTKKGFLPEPSCEVTKVETTKTYNSISGELEIGMDIRYLPAQSIKSIVKQIEEALNGIKCDYNVEVEHNHGGAFELKDERFKETCTSVLEEVRGTEPDKITDGGASDGRFFAEAGTPFIELGTNQESVHGEDEYCSVENLRKLRKSFYRISKRLTG